MPRAKESIYLDRADGRDKSVKKTYFDMEQGVLDSISLPPAGSCIAVRQYLATEDDYELLAEMIGVNEMKEAAPYGPERSPDDKSSRAARGGKSCIVSTQRFV